MKKYDVMRLSGTVLLAHLALCAAVFLLLAATSGTTAGFTFRSPYGLALGVLGAAALAFVLGWGLRPVKDPFEKNLCWNAAMVLYVLNAAAFLFSPEPVDGPLLPMLWSLPLAPALTGVGAFAAPRSVLYLFGGALLAAVEPMCLTLGLLSGSRAEKAAPDAEEHGDTSAGAEETTDDKENMPHA